MHVKEKKNNMVQLEVQCPVVAMGKSKKLLLSLQGICNSLKPFQTIACPFLNFWSESYSRTLWKSVIHVIRSDQIKGLLWGLVMWQTSWKSYCFLIYY